MQDFTTRPHATFEDAVRAQDARARHSHESRKAVNTDPRPDARRYHDPIVYAADLQAWERRATLRELEREPDVAHADATRFFGQGEGENR